MAETDPQALLDLTTFLVGAACGALATSALAVVVTLVTRPREEAPRDANGG